MARPYSAWKDAALNPLVSQSIFFPKKGGEGYFGWGRSFRGLLCVGWPVTSSPSFLGRIFVLWRLFKGASWLWQPQNFFPTHHSVWASFGRIKFDFRPMKKLTFSMGFSNLGGKRWCLVGDDSKPLDKKPTDTHGFLHAIMVAKARLLLAWTCWSQTFFQPLDCWNHSPPLWLFDLYVCLLYAFCLFFSKMG